MINEKLYSELTNRILKIFDKFGNEIPFNRLELKMYKAKYSSTGKETLTLFIDDVPVTNLKDKKYKVQFKCSCGLISTILLCKYLLKEKISCRVCKEHGEKAEWQRLMFEIARNGKVRGNKERNVYRVVYDFDSENEDYKKEYFDKHLTLDEFEKYKKYIYSIDDIVIENRTDYTYLPHEPSKNAKKYTSKILIDGVVHSMQNIELRCPLCGKVFHITRGLKEKVKNNNFDCKYCSLVNKTFSVKRYKDNLTYQSKEELSFIKKCETHNIFIVDGDKIEYVYSNKNLKYIIDFKLPDYKLFIEIKDNHIWHKEQVESGKWQAKVDSAEQYASKIGYKYKVLFPNDIEDFFNCLLKR